MLLVKSFYVVTGFLFLITFVLQLRYVHLHIAIHTMLAHITAEIETLQNFFNIQDN